MVIGSGREEHFVIRPSRIDVIIFSSEVLLATDSYHLNSVGIPVDFIKACLWLDGVRESIFIGPRSDHSLPMSVTD